MVYGYVLFMQTIKLWFNETQMDYIKNYNTLKFKINIQHHAAPI